jgi:hypothetical protein
MSYAGLVPISSAAEAHLGGNIREGDPFTHSPKVWNYIIDRFAIKSILDLGSGLGYSSQYFFNRGRQVIAIDGLKENIEKAVYPTMLFDLERGQCSAQWIWSTAKRSWSTLMKSTWRTFSSRSPVASSY